jgi:hypothetical protein
VNCGPNDLNFLDGEGEMLADFLNKIIYDVLNLLTYRAPAAQASACNNNGAFFSSSWST